MNTTCMLYYDMDKIVNQVTTYFNFIIANTHSSNYKNVTSSRVAAEDSSAKLLLSRVFSHAFDERQRAPRLAAPNDGLLSVKRRRFALNSGRPENI